MLSSLDKSQLLASPEFFTDLAHFLYNEQNNASLAKQMLLSAIETVLGGISSNTSMAYTVLFKLKEMGFWNEAKFIANKLKTSLPERPTSHWFVNSSPII